MEYKLVLFISNKINKNEIKIALLATYILDNFCTLDQMQFYDWLQLLINILLFIGYCK